MKVSFFVGVFSIKGVVIQKNKAIHEASEQIWYATKGCGKLLLADGEEKEFKAGDVVRFADKDIHGLYNDGETEFVYISVTAPPIHFGYAYRGKI